MEQNILTSYLESKSESLHISINDPKEFLFNITSSCLLKEMRYYDSSEQRCNIIQAALNAVARIDPEFILKLVLYLRHQLYLRTTPNFILAFSILNPQLQPYIQKYFGASIILPTDLIEVCSYVQFLHIQMLEYNNNNNNNQQKIIDIRKKFFFPKILQICIQEKFPQFSIYQLGKYCSESARKKLLNQYLQFKDIDAYNKKKQRQKNKTSELILKDNIIKHQQAKISSQKGQFEINILCMKDIIKFCHCKAPQYSIRCILGKKYPQNNEEFNSLFLKEIKKFKLKSNNNNEIQYNSALALTRMKLEIPKTWETELSQKGNKKEVWEELIFGNQLPQLALIRNLRNILKAGISDLAHYKVISNICDQQQVIRAKILPVQYFSALTEIDKIIELVKNSVNVDQKVQKKQFLAKDIQEIIIQFGEIYKKAINKAINLSIAHNLNEIKGFTVIFVDVSGSMTKQISGGSHYGSLQRYMDIALLLGLMIKSKCTFSNFYLFSSPSELTKKCYQKIKEFKQNDYLENIAHCKCQNLLGHQTCFPFECIKKFLIKKIKIDNIIIISDMMISKENKQISTFLNTYKNQINEDLKIFSIDLVGYGEELNFSDEFNEKNYIKIFGMSDTILQFISLREKSQMEEINHYAKIKLAKYQSELIK